MPNTDRRTLSRRHFLRAAGMAGALAAVAPSHLFAQQTKPLNVLFIPVDDLRLQLGCYGATQMKTPNIDRLAASGMAFDHTYCQQAVCGPTRASLLTGLRPDSTTIYDLNHPVQTTLPDAVTLPQMFRNAGYETISLGKVYHHRHDDKKGWSIQNRAPSGQSKYMGYCNPKSIAILERNREAAKKEFAHIKNDKKRRRAISHKGRGPAYEYADVPDNAYPDGAMTDLAIEELRRLATEKKPFFLAAGLKKPHLPFTAPKKYWDLYKPEDIKTTPAPNPPEGAPPYALTTWGELRSYDGIPKKEDVSPETERNLIHGYCACVSFIDAQIGRLLDALDETGLADNTVVVLWGDHGWKLGDYGDWCKHTNVEFDTHVPMIWRVPGMKAAGRHCPALTEYVDIYPTLAALCGLTPPATIEGTSMAPLFDRPDQPWKTAAFSQYPRQKTLMGYSMRTERYRLTRWIDRKTHEEKAIELYDHQGDPYETVNIATKPENAELVEKLRKMSAAGWKATKPPKTK